MSRFCVKMDVAEILKAADQWRKNCIQGYLMRNWLIKILFFSFFILPNNSIADIYKSVDSNGVMHFTDSVPEKDKKNVELYHKTVDSKTNQHISGPVSEEDNVNKSEVVISDKNIKNPILNTTTNDEQFMDSSSWFILIGFACIGMLIIQAIQKSKKKDSIKDKLNNLNDFSVSQKIISIDGNSGIAVDEQKNKICLISVSEALQNYGNIELDIISYHDLLSSKIYEDGETVTKTSRGSQVGGALIGGLALGGIGAIIGGLSGKKTSHDKVNKIDLRITVNRTNNPIHDIRIMADATKKQGFIYKDAMKKARHWHGLMEVLIKRADTDDEKKDEELIDKNTQSILHHSVAEELTKLSELLKQGLLTNEEFIEQKVKLLTREI